MSYSGLCCVKGTRLGKIECEKAVDDGASHRIGKKSLCPILKSNAVLRNNSVSLSYISSLAYNDNNNDNDNDNDNHNYNDNYNDNNNNNNNNRILNKRVIFIRAIQQSTN